MSDPTVGPKTGRIAELRALGLDPRLEILAHCLTDEESAFRVEAAAIDLLGLGSLTNLVSGWRSLELGRMSLEELMGYYAAEPVTVTEPSLLIRINRLYRHGMSALELYEATRGIWRVGPRREGATLAFAVFEGIVREVYELNAWHPALSTPYETRVLTPAEAIGRWEFTASLAAEPIRTKYRNGLVKSYFSRGQQSPVSYVNC